MTILKFGSGDPSVVLECAMTSEADIIAKGGTLRSGATVSANGVTGASAGAVVFDITGYDRRLDSNFQISFETPAHYLTATEGATGNPTPHGGHDHYADSTSDAVHWAANTADNNTGSYALFNTYSSDNRHGYKIQHGVEGDYFNTGRSLCYANGEWTRVTLVLNDKTRDTYFNGVKVFTGTTAGLTPGGGELNFQCIGSAGGSILPVLSGQPYRNLTISYKPVSRVVHPLLAGIEWVGDSFVAQSQTDTLSLKADPWRSSIAFAMQGEFATHGLGCNVNISAGVSGATIYTSGTPIASQITAVLVRNPRIVCYRGGTNDAIYAGGVGGLGTITSLTDPALKAQMTTILDHPSVEYVVLGTVPTLENGDGGSSPDYQSSTYRDAVTAVNVLINSMPAWAAANGYTGRILIADQYTSWGGPTNYNSEWFQTSNIHPGSYGKWEQGKLYAKAIMDAI